MLSILLLHNPFSRAHSGCSLCRKYNFLALDQLQCPGLQRLVTVWRELQRRKEPGSEPQPALYFDTFVSFARFV